MVSFPLGVRRECIFSLIFLESRFLSVAHPTVANLSTWDSVHWQVSVRPQYLVMFLSFCWITGGHTTHPLAEGLLFPAGIEPTPTILL